MESATFGSASSTGKGFEAGPRRVFERRNNEMMAAMGRVRVRMRYPQLTGVGDPWMVHLRYCTLGSPLEA